MPVDICAKQMATAAGIIRRRRSATGPAVKSFLRAFFQKSAAFFAYPKPKHC
jgi:hypothetical protein